MKILAIQTNSEGRPCGWGLATVESSDPDLARRVAKGEAHRQWDAHSCYPGERKGKMLLHILEEEE